jgi:hypothetical protein
MYWVQNFRWPSACIWHHTGSGRTEPIKEPSVRPAEAYPQREPPTKNSN